MTRPNLTRALSIVLAAAVAATSGCAATKKSTAAAAPPAVSPEQALANARAELASSGARLASVVDTAPADKMIAIDPAASADFPVGSTATIIDGSQNVVGHAEVTASSTAGVYAKYYATSRDAQVGDVAVKF